MEPLSVPDTPGRRIKGQKELLEYTARNLGKCPWAIHIHQAMTPFIGCRVSLSSPNTNRTLILVGHTSGRSQLELLEEAKRVRA